MTTGEGIVLSALGGILFITAVVAISYTNGVDDEFKRATDNCLTFFSDMKHVEVVEHCANIIGHVKREST